jgi:hypothetical protein
VVAVEKPTMVALVELAAAVLVVLLCLLELLTQVEVLVVEVLVAVQA